MSYPARVEGLENMDINMVEISKKRCPGYDIKLHLIFRLLFWITLSTSSLPLLPNPLWSWLVVPVKVLSMDQIGHIQKKIFFLNIKQMWMWMYQEPDSLMSSYKITLTRLTCCWNQSINFYLAFFILDFIPLISVWLAFCLLTHLILSMS